MNESQSIFIAGSRGLVGSACVRRWRDGGFEKVLTATRDELDLTDARAVDTWFEENRPRYVLHAAGKVGGILANSREPVEFLHDNVLMAVNVLKAAWRTGVEKLLYLGSSCIYPRECPQPIRESYLLSGPLEKTNEAYALSKIAGVLACDAYRRQYGCDFISVMPTNLYGPGDNFHPENSHVLPALIRRFHEAKEQRESTVTVWGTGTPRREFLHVDDLADACFFLMRNYSEAGPINVGVGEDLPIRELAETVRDIVHPSAAIEFDTSKPDGTPRKLLDVSRITSLGWKARISLREGIAETYRWYCESHLAESENG